MSECPMCGGKRGSGKTTYSVDLGTGVVVVRNVPAEICMQCGEEWIGPDVANALEQIVEKARAARAEVEVVAL
jgi:YgiT-type zinc finger domain-containing protein